MDAIALIRASSVLPILAALEQDGAPVDRLLARVGLPAWTLSHAEDLIPTSCLVRILTEASRTHGVDGVGLRAAQPIRIDALGIYGRLIRSRPTLGDALGTLVGHYPAFSSSGRMWTVACGDHVRICHDFGVTPFDMDEGWQEMSRYVLMLMLEVVRLGTGPIWQPSEVQMPTGYSGITTIAVSMALLEAPLPRWLGVPVERDDLDVWKSSAPAMDFVGSMVQVVETLSWERYPDIRLTAKVLGTSVRTLQRQLAAAGLTHTALIDRVRFGTASALLQETDAKVIDIAFDLGYSDHAHFTRAFRRWAACSPQEFRRRHERRQYA